VPIGNTDAIEEWVRDHEPDDYLWRQVVQVVLALSDRPWLAPSTPFGGGSGEDSALREIPVADTGLVILYEHRHSDGLVDLHYIATELG
jgi:hypothetical protein